MTHPAKRRQSDGKPGHRASKVSFLLGALVVDTSGGRAARRMAWRAGPTGVQDPGEPSRGFPWNLGGLPSPAFPRIGTGVVEQEGPRPSGSASFTGGSEGQDAAWVSRSERNELARRAAEVGVSSQYQCSGLTFPREPVKGKGAPCHRPVAGNTVRASNLESVST